MADTQTSSDASSTPPASEAALAPAEAAASAPPRPAPSSAAPRRRTSGTRSRRQPDTEPARTIFGRRRVRARRVRRTIRHIDPWSVFKVAIVFCVCLYGALMLAAWLLWGAAVAAGLVDNIESFFVEIGLFDELEFDGEVLFRATAVGGLVFAVASAAAIVLMTVVFNLISDVMGGIRISVLEEDIAYVKPEGRRGVPGTPQAPQGPPV